MPWNVVILGGGYGGYTAAHRLEKLLPSQSARVTLISDQNFMLNTTLLPGASGGTLEPRHVVVPLREELHDTHIRLGRVTGHDREARRVTYAPAEGEEEHVVYDHLVVALGSTSKTLPVPGLSEHAMGFKTISEAIALRNRLISCMERAEAEDDLQHRLALLSFVFVGGGYAGLEGLAELQDLASDLVERYPRCKNTGMRFVLIEARDRVMGEISAGLAEFAADELRRRGLEIRTNTQVARIEADVVTLKGGERIPCRTVCWTAGVTPVPVVRALGLELQQDGRIVTDRCCRVPGAEGVWAIGDAAAIPDPARPGQPSPPTAQHALRQGKTVARNVARALAGRPPKPFTYKTLGVFVDMGRHQAVAETLKIKWRGFPAWFLARTYHLSQMPGYKRRLRITLDWTVDLVFSRDGTELGQLGHPPRLEDMPTGSPSSGAGDEARGEERGGFAGVALDDGPGPQAGS